MQNWPLVSIVVVTYKNRQLLEKAIDSILQTNYPRFEVVIVVNSNEDGSLDFLRQIAKSDDRLIVIDAKENIGHSAGMNLAVQKSRSEYIAKLDDDVIVDPNWLKELIKILLGKPKVGQAQSNIIEFDLFRNGKAREKSAKVSDLDYLVIATRERYTKDVEEIFFASSCATAMKKELFNKAGGLDEALFVYFDDADLGWRLRLMGYKNYIVPGSMVYHKGRITLRRNRVFGIYHFRKNHIAMLIKNYNLFNLLRYLPIFSVFMWVQALFNLVVEKNIVYLIACNKAFWWNIRNLKYIFSERKIVQKKLRRISDNELKKSMVPIRIPWHFLK